MKCSSSLINDTYLIPLYLDKETDGVVKYRLAFLNSIKCLDYDLERACGIFRIAVPTAYVWIRQWNERGYDGLVHPFHQPGSKIGHPPKLAEEELEELKLILLAKDKWLTKEIHALILDRWGVELSRWQISRILKGKFKMQLSKPYPHDYRRPADAEKRLEASLEAAYQTLEAKGFSKEDIAIGFLDEASPQTTANTVRFWHFGHLDITKDTTRRKANSIGFYAIKGESVQGFLPDSTQESIAAFMQQVGEANTPIYKAAIVLLDNFSSHISRKARETADFAHLELVFLPAYSPDLNPIEYIWKTVKRRISEKFVSSLDHLKDIIADTWDDESNKMSYAKSWIEKFTPWVEYREFCT